MWLACVEIRTDIFQTLGNYSRDLGAVAPTAVRLASGVARVIRRPFRTLGVVAYPGWCNDRVRW